MWAVFISPSVKETKYLMHIKLIEKYISMNSLFIIRNAYHDVIKWVVVCFAKQPEILLYLSFSQAFTRD